MILDAIGRTCVEEFWRRCEGAHATFPRHLENLIALTLPVALVKLPRLGLTAIREWLEMRIGGTWPPFAGTDRALRGCIVAAYGQGLIFLDGTDQDDEWRFTLAHELAHFLLDYWMPRRRVLDKLGPSFAAVLDAQRPPTADERLAALLARVPLRPYVNLMERGERGGDIHADLDAIETRADSVAVALLAPAGEVMGRADFSEGFFADRREKLIVLLQSVFGLPAHVARTYSSALLVAAGKGRSWAESLRD